MFKMAQNSFLMGCHYQSRTFLCYQILINIRHNFKKFKVALSPMYFAESCVSSCLLKFDRVTKKNALPFLNDKQNLR